MGDSFSPPCTSMGTAQDAREELRRNLTATRCLKVPSPLCFAEEDPNDATWPVFKTFGESMYNGPVKKWHDLDLHATDLAEQLCLDQEERAGGLEVDPGIFDMGSHFMAFYSTVYDILEPAIRDIKVVDTNSI